MKQHITVDQLTELSDKGKARLRESWQPQNGDKVWYDDQTKSGYVGFLTDNGEGYWNDMSDPDWNKNDFMPLLSIGQMIEFLDEKQPYQYGIHRRIVDWKVVVHDRQYGKVMGEELCDSLWQAVKQILNEE